MARFGFTRSINVQSGPKINSRLSRVPRARSGGSLVAFAASAVLVTMHATLRRIQLRLSTGRTRTPYTTASTRPGLVDTGPDADVPERRQP